MISFQCLTNYKICTYNEITQLNKQQVLLNTIGLLIEQRSFNKALEIQEMTFLFLEMVYF